MLGDVIKLFVFKSLLTTPKNVWPLQLKQTFPPIISIFTEEEGDGIKSRLSFKKFSTLPDLKKGNLWFLEVFRSKQEKCRWLEWKKIMPHCFDNFFVDKENIYSKFVKVIQAIKCSLPFPQIFTHCKHEMTIQIWRQQDKSRNFLVGKRKCEEMSSPEKVSKSIQANS